MDEIREIVRKVLEQGYLLSLATADNTGIWVADVVYVNDKDFNIYWLSHHDTRHSKAIMKNPSVAGTITISNNPGEQDVGLQIEGQAEKIEGDILLIAKKHLAKRGKPAPTKEGEIFETGQSWYRMKPKKIELIHEPIFGRIKKALDF